MDEICLELGTLRLEHTVELGSEHDVALDLELARHESLLAVELALSEVDKGVVSKVNDDISLALGLALVGGVLLLEVDGLNELLAASVLDVDLEDTVGLLAEVRPLVVRHALDALLNLLEVLNRLELAHCVLLGVMRKATVSLIYVTELRQRSAGYRLPECNSANNMEI